MEQKLRAIERGESVKLISSDLGVGMTQVKDWQRNKNNIQDYCVEIE